MSDKVVIRKLNETFVRLEAERGILQEISSIFTFKVPGYKFVPAYRNGYWSGDIFLLNLRTNTIYSGLVPDIVDFCESRGYPVEFQDLDRQVDNSDRIEKFLSYIIPKLPFEPRDYQLEAVRHCLTEKRSVLLSPTGSGKSLIIYLLSQYITGLNKKNKVLVIVPTISLVHQMSSDFENYHKSEMDILRITAGVIKDVSGVQYVISTWQSLQKESEDFFNQFACVINDEAHQCKAKVLTSIMEKCTNVVYRFGTTGTLDGENVHKLVLQGLFGVIKRVATTTELIEQKHLAPLKINAIVLNYKRTDDIKKIKSYQDEIDYLVGNEKRNKFIVDLVKRLDKTTLVLFRFVEKHGKVLHKMLEEQMSDVHYISGEVDGEERETIRHLMETPDKKQVLIGSLQTLSTGVNIKNIHNIVFVAPTKSQITLLQSIGRGLRTHEQKDVLQIYDLVDSFEGKKQNFALKHFMERVKVYDNESFDYSIKKMDIDKHY